MGSHQYSGVPHIRLAVALAASATALVAPIAVSSAAVAAVDNHLTQVSVATPESGPNGSFARAISNDGRYVVFASHQPNLVPSEPGDVGRYVYLRDTQTDTTTRLSHGTDGYLIGNAAISGNGRYVVFASKEGPFDQAALRLVNTKTGKVRVIAQTSTPGTQIIDWYSVGISDNASSVVYTQTTSADDVTWVTRIYRYDVASRTTTPLVDGPIGGPPNRSNYATVPSLSADGRYVTLVQATDPGADMSPYELVRLDTTTGARLVIDTSTPQNTPGNAFGEPSLSNSGRYVAFHDLDAAGAPHVYLHDVDKHTTKLVDRTAAGQPSATRASQPQVSGDGRYVAFSSSATDLVAGTPAVGQIYLWDRTTRGLDAIVRNRQGLYPGSPGALSSMPYIDGDGSTVGFTSTALNLAPGQAATRLERVFVWQR
jgi:Tol biopolymer transport system component